MRTLHPCLFNFQDQNIRRVGSTIDGGTSLSGIRDDIETTGGGYWRADFNNGRTRSREQGLAWRAIVDGLDNGAGSIVVLFCERLFQPVDDVVSVPHSDGTPFSDGTEYETGRAAYTAAAAPLRSTLLTISGTSEKQLIGGEIFSIRHPNWGWRAYRIISIDGNQVTIRPPLREAIEDATALEFDKPRCQMCAAPDAEIGNPTNLGRYTVCNLALVEDMRKPA